MKPKPTVIEKEGNAIKFLMIWTYIVIIPVALCALILSIPIIVWRMAVLIAEMVEWWIQNKYRE